VVGLPLVSAKAHQRRPVRTGGAGLLITGFGVRIPGGAPFLSRIRGSGLSSARPFEWSKVGAITSTSLERLETLPAKEQGARPDPTTWPDLARSWCNPLGGGAPLGATTPLPMALSGRDH